MSSLKNVSLDILDNDMMTIQKMIFIYNAVLKGWTVRRIGPDRFEFTTAIESQKQEVNLEDYLKKFIIYNLNIDNLKAV